MSAPMPMPMPGQQMTAEQIEAIKAHMQADAQRLGISMEDYMNQMRALQAKQQQQQKAAGQHQHHHGHDHDHDHDHHDHDHDHGHNHGNENGHRQAVQPGPPKPEALAVAAFLRAQQLKPRTCIFQEKRKDMFRVKRAMRALQSPAYEKARRKNVLLPAVADHASAEATFKLLPLSLLALRVKKVDDGDGDEPGHEGHNHGNGKPAKRIKGLWTVEIVQQQEADEDMYYMWLYEGPQWRQRAYALGALAGVMTLVMFPLWPLKLRQGAWYLSMAFFGLIILFFVMAIFRLILFLITMFTHAPGLWLFPNLFEDVGFFESFVPLWAWQEDKKAARKRMRMEKEKKATAKAERLAKANGAESKPAESKPTELKATAKPKATGTDAKESAGSVQKRVMQASVEEAEDE